MKALKNFFITLGLILCTSLMISWVMLLDSCASHKPTKGKDTTCG